jgi:AcrR family transcriptional regulator
MPPTKGQRTRDHIVSTVAPIFNRHGYAGTTLEDVMAASGLKKGGVYRHFESKDDLAFAAFEHALALQGDRIRDAIVAGTTAEEKISGLARAMARNGDDPPIPGGCPILNTAVECDDAPGPIYTRLRTRARRAMTALIGAAEQLFADGIASGEMRDDIDPHDEAAALVSSLEGALMLSRLYADPSHVQRAAARVEERVRSLRRSAPRARRTAR